MKAEIDQDVSGLRYMHYVDRPERRQDETSSEAARPANAHCERAYLTMNLPAVVHTTAHSSKLQPIDLSSPTDPS